jgi:hypothetical protein
MEWYRRLFSIHEIEENKILWFMFGATILSYFAAFNSWFYQKTTTIDAYLDGSYTCWPYFQSCENFLFLRTLPEGYSQPFLYMVLFGLLISAVYFALKKDWVKAHMALMPSFVWHTFTIFFLTFSISGNYDYYLFALAFVLLFFPHKEFFLKLTLVLFYFTAATIKIHEGWILGTYFSALKTGMPIFPDWSIPIWTNFVIFMQIVGAWFLLSSNRLLQHTAFIYFVAFHLYSGLLVGFRYPVTVLPSIIILFGPMYSQTKIPFDKKSVFGWLLVGFVIVAQSISILIPGDVKMTMEGNKYGLYMFEANHQCISTTDIHYIDGSNQVVEKQSGSSRSRCDPYSYWFRIKTACERDVEVERISWTFDHSTNGGPFMRIVSAEDACTLEYKPFSHNDWIKVVKDNPEIIGVPVENVYD